jgi:hypothetical protein
MGFGGSFNKNIDTEEDEDEDVWWFNSWFLNILSFFNRFNWS